MKRLFKRMGLFLGWSLLSLYLAIALLPKEQLYYLLEETLAPMQVYINDESVTDYLLGVSIDNGTLLYQDIEAVELSEISLTTLLFYNALTIDAFTVKEDLAAFVPEKVETISLTHSIFAPHLLFITAKGDFGEAVGKANLIERKVRVDFNFEPLMSRNHGALLKMLKRDQKGYYYEYAF